MTNELYIKITEILLYLGIKPKMAGFDYLRSAIGFSYSTNQFEKVTTEIYPKVGKEYSITEDLVERSIRMVIVEAHENGGLLGVNELFDQIVFNNKYLLSTGEFISIVAEIIRLQEIRKMLSLAGCGLERVN